MSQQNQQRVQYQQSNQPTTTTAVTGSNGNTTNYDPAEVALTSEIVSALVDKKGIEYFWKTADNNQRQPYVDRMRDIVWVAKAVAKVLRES